MHEDLYFRVTEPEAALRAAKGSYGIDMEDMQEPQQVIWSAEGHVLHREASSTDIEFEKRRETMQHVRDLFRELATFDPGDAFVLSVYLDMRPHVPGENPAIRTGLIVLKDRFRQIDKTC